MRMYLIESRGPVIVRLFIIEFDVRRTCRGLSSVERCRGPLSFLKVETVHLLRPVITYSYCRLVHTYELTHLDVEVPSKGCIRIGLSKSTQTVCPNEIHIRFQ